jgi:hypothetical protein
MQVFNAHQGDFMKLNMFGSDAHYSNHSNNTSLHSNHALSLLGTMVDLNYVRFDSGLQRFAFTKTGADYAHRYATSIKYYIKKNKMTLEQFGVMAEFVSNLFGSMSGNVLECGARIDELGERVNDYNTVSFVSKSDQQDQPMG